MTSIIKVNNLGKKYILNHQAKQQYKSIRDVLANKFKNIGRSQNQNSPQKEEFWALKDINFEIQQGDKVGIIGRNGAGKSTLLKILSRITEPTTGSIKINGRVASLLEVGTGFHPELTGRENIYLNGAILGMSRSEIKQKFDEIVDFAEVEKFLDTPVKRYSSGMYMRLAFAVAAHLEPEILIVDEVLAVGDAQFQKKCLGKMGEIGNQGRTVLFVSHSMAAIRAMCDKALLLNKGEVAAFTSVEDAFSDYAQLADDVSLSNWHKPKFTNEDSDIAVHTDTSEFVTCIGGEILSENGDIEANLEINKSFKVALRYKVRKELPYNLIPNFHLYDEFGGRFFISFPELAAPSSVGEHVAVCVMDPFLFNVGRFSLMPVLSSYEMLGPVHFAMENALRFEVYESSDADSRRHGWGGNLPGLTRPRLKWEYTSL